MKLWSLDIICKLHVERASATVFLQVEINLLSRQTASGRQHVRQVN